MSPPTRRYPVVSFGPEMLAALLRGSREKIRISLSSYRAAVKAQQRFSLLKKALRDEKHPYATVATRAQCRILWGTAAGLPAEPSTTTRRGMSFPSNRGCAAVLEIAPQDLEFRDAILASGVSPAEISADDPLGEVFKNLDREEVMKKGSTLPPVTGDRERELPPKTAEVRSNETKETSLSTATSDWLDSIIDSVKK